VSPDAGARYYERNGADTAVEVNRIEVGDQRTIVPAAAHATVSVRLAPGQRSTEIAPVLERLLRDAAPEGADVDIELMLSEPALFPVDSEPMRLASEAIATATGMTPVFQRTGGSIPIVADFAAKGITTIVSGFALADDDIHAPNESYRLESLRLGERSAYELYRALAAL
jgi:acetylornithine deacetylase/succinyl-diaminopimelate desuccinylase-like protein